jgi:hypothetical protein
MYFLVACILGIAINDYKPELHDLNSETFLFSQYEWGGVGRTYSSRWVTMISPSYFISSTHFFPHTQESVDFKVDGITYQYMIDELRFPLYTEDASGNLKPSDLMIGRLTEETNLPYYQIAGDFSLQNDLIGVGVPLKAGTNRVEKIYGYARGSSDGENFYTMVASYKYDDIPNEFYFLSRDSGAPTFLPTKGALELVGIHYWSGGLPVRFGAQCGDSYVPYYKDQIFNLEIPGDFEVDHIVDSKDLDKIRSRWGVYGSEELDIIRSEWGRTGPGYTKSVPEPNIFSIFLLFLLCLLRRRI